MKLISASATENGDSGWNGKALAGDGTGREVVVRGWYDKPWDTLIRYPNPDIAARAAETAYKLAISPLVGYDQSERNSLYFALQGNRFSPDYYIMSGERTETDCSAFVYAAYACHIAAIRSNGNAPTTRDMANRYRLWGFHVTPYDGRVESLCHGDILVATGKHAVMCYDPEKVGEEAAESLNSDLRGVYVAMTDVCCRKGAGIDRLIVGIVPTGGKMQCYGYYTFRAGRRWLYVTTTICGVDYVGFVSERYVTKVSEIEMEENGNV